MKEKGINVRFYCGIRAVPQKIKIRLATFKYLFNKKKYPLFFLSPAKNGLIKTRRILRAFGMKKLVKYGNHFFFSLITPHFPSKPYDLMVANGGLNIMGAGTPVKQHMDMVILAITRRCNYQCRHCYERHNISDTEGVTIHKWKEVIQELQHIGVSIITFSGGEPMLQFDQMLELLELGDKSRSDFHLHTSGENVTLENARALKKAGLTAAAVGLDDVNPDRHDHVRGKSGAFEEAVSALKNFRDANIFTYINLCLSKELIHSGDLLQYLELARDLNVGIVRLLEPRPCGGFLGKSPDELFPETDRDAITEFYQKINSEKKYHDLPLIAYTAYYENPRRLGCMGGALSHFYIDGLGNIQPCVYLPVVFGNINEEKVSSVMARMKTVFPHPLKIECPANLLPKILSHAQESKANPPIPFHLIEAEWNKMFFNPGEGGRQQDTKIAECR